MTHKERMALIDKIVRHDVLARQWRIVGASSIESMVEFNHRAAQHELKAMQFRNMLAMDSWQKRRAAHNNSPEVIFGALGYERI